MDKNNSFEHVESMSINGLNGLKDLDFLKTHKHLEN